MLLDGEAAPRHGIFAGMRRILDEAYEGPGGYRGQGRDRYSTMGSDERVWFARNDQWSYVWYQDRGHEELYRIEADPLQARDVLAEHREVAARLRRALKAWIAGMRASAGSLPLRAEPTEPGTDRSSD